MIDRLSHIIDEYNLTASQFADEIGVQRSSVSHVLSGRNKPSLDFITKVILRYPEINAEWLLTGQGRFRTDLQQAASDEAVHGIRPGAGEETNDASGFGTRSGDAAPAVNPQKETGRRRAPSGKDLSRIIFFYADGSFEEYLPRS